MASCCGVYDGKEIHLYIDGLLDNSLVGSGYMVTNHEPVWIGENSEELGREWNGLIDDVRIYSYALSPEQIRMLYEGKEPPSKK